MAFDVEITFTGICGFVDRDVSAGGPAAGCVVMQNAWWKNPFGPGDGRDISVINGEPLRRHRSFLRFSLGDLEGSPVRVGNSECVVYLDGSVVTMDSDALPNYTLDSSLANLADLGQRLGGRGRIDKLLKAPTRDRVTCLFLIDRGLVGARSEMFEWHLGDVVAENQSRLQGLSNEIKVEVRSVQRFGLTIAPLGQPEAWRLLNFKPALGSRVEITCASLCDFNPLQWGDEPSEPLERVDRDFLWHYQCLDGADGLSESFPASFEWAPRYEPGAGGGTGLNCIPPQYAPSDFPLSHWGR